MVDNRKPGHMEGEERHVDTVEASGGSKEGVVRWVLVIGTLLAIVLLSIVWITGAATQDDQESEITGTGNIDAMENDGADTDGVVSDGMDEIDAAPEAADGSDTPLETIDN